MDIWVTQRHIKKKEIACIWSKYFTAIWTKLIDVHAGLTKAAKEEHARDLPIMNGIKEIIKSIEVLDSGSSNYREALYNLSTRLNSFQVNKPNSYPKNKLYLDNYIITLRFLLLYLYHLEHHFYVYISLQKTFRIVHFCLKLATYLCIRTGPVFRHISSCCWNYTY
jgi:hypothetical protein